LENRFYVINIYFIAQSALQVLTNPKTSFVRKRQMMQQLFGDYRQKMHDEEVTTRKRMFFKIVDLHLDRIFLGHNQIQSTKNSEVPLASRFVRRVHQNNDSIEKNDQKFSFAFDIPPSDIDKK
jgi:hypothetical protein